MIEHGHEPRSGIVLFPQTGGRDDITAATVRQFGLATNAYVSGGEVHAGTVHAVGYDPQLALDLQTMHTLRGERATPTERHVLDEFGRLIKAELDERGIVLAALEDVLLNRPLDVIVPAEVDRAAILQTRLPYIPVKTVQRAIPNIWQQTATGLFVAQTPNSIDATHMLSRRNLNGVDGGLKSNEVRTGAATRLPQVRQTATYQTYSYDSQLVASSPGYQRTIATRQTTIHTAIFDIPPPNDPRPLQQLLKLDFENQQSEQHYDEISQEPNSDGALWYAYNGAPGVASTGHVDYSEGTRARLAGLLDPLENNEWRSRLT